MKYESDNEKDLDGPDDEIGGRMKCAAIVNVTPPLVEEDQRVDAGMHLVRS